MRYQYLVDFRHGICHFFIRYCGIGYPTMSPSKCTSSMWICCIKYVYMLVCKGFPGCTSHQRTLSMTWKPCHFKEPYTCINNQIVKMKNASFLKWTQMNNNYITYKMKVGPNCETLCESPRCNYLSIRYHRKK